jgi:hypothetical protein
MSGRIALVGIASALWIGHASALPSPAKSNCETIAKAEADFAKFIAPDKAQFTKATPGQFHFLQGVAAINPDTPPGLPPGDTAILAKGDRSDEGVILFVRAGKMCLPMEAPKMLIELMGRILTDRLDAEGSEM